MNTEATLGVHLVAKIACSILESLGSAAERASIQVWHLVEAELRGHPSHGLQRLPVLVERIRNGVLLPNAEVRITARTPAFVAVDGNNGFGPWVMSLTLPDLLDRARQFGVAVAAIARASHLGVLAPYANWCTQKGLIAILTTTSEALVHPFGGSSPELGTNPISIGIPAEPDPLIVDMATGVVSMGRIIHYESEGMSLDPGWAVDANGVPTTDPTSARAGAIAPFGGAKGYALGLALESLVAGLSETSFGTDVTGTLDTGVPVTKGDLVLVIDPRACQIPRIEDRVGSYLEAVRSSRPIENSPGVRIPGDASRQRRTVSMSAGITLTPAVRDQLVHLHEELVGPIEWTTPCRT